MNLTAHYQMFGRYNAWANGRLCAAAPGLDTRQYRADRGAFFKSVHGTLNHLLVTDRVWLRRFTGEGDAPDRLDAILFEDFDGLRAAPGGRGPANYRLCGRPQRGSDRRDHHLPAGFHARAIRAATGAGAGPLVQPSDPSPRQAHAVLTGLVGQAPELDLLFFQRLAAKPAASQAVG
jgi:hypothetical protein